MGNSLEGKVAIVTGAGQGIGRGIATVLANDGVKIAVATRSRENGQETVDSITAAGQEAYLYQIDVGRPEKIKALVDDVADKYGRLDIVVHNAGVFPFQLIEDLVPKDLDYTLDVNLKACFFLTKYSVPIMREAGSGRILVTSSITGPRVAEPGLAYYAASKAGVNGFIRAAAMEYAKDKITVNGIEPGYIMTPAMQTIGTPEELAERVRYIPLGHYGTPLDIAYAMKFLASDEAAYITGQTLIIDGGSTLPESPLSIM